MRHSQIFDTLFKLGQSLEKSGNARVASAIMMKNKLISFGFNSTKSHPFQQKYSSNDLAIYMHSEVDAIKNALKLISVKDFKHCSLFIMRVKEDQHKTHWMTGLSKPCDGCLRAIANFSINRIYYTDENSKEFCCY